jgi:hypothetical protein
MAWLASGEEDQVNEGSIRATYFPLPTIEEASLNTLLLYFNEIFIPFGFLDEQFYERIKPAIDEGVVETLDPDDLPQPLEEQLLHYRRFFHVYKKTEEDLAALEREGSPYSVSGEGDGSTGPDHTDVVSSSGGAPGDELSDPMRRFHKRTRELIEELDQTYRSRMTARYVSRLKKCILPFSICLRPVMKYMHANYGFEPLTDYPRLNEALMASYSDAAAEHLEEIRPAELGFGTPELRLATAATTAVVPLVTHAEVEDILEARSKLEAELGAFRREIYTLSKSMTESPDSELFERELQTIVTRSIQPTVAELERAMRLSTAKSIVRVARGILRAQPAVPLVACLFPGIPAWAAIAAATAAAMGAIDETLDILKRHRDAKGSSGLSYLIALRRAIA